MPTSTIYCYKNYKKALSVRPVLQATDKIWLVILAASVAKKSGRINMQMLYMYYIMRPRSSFRVLFAPTHLRTIYRASNHPNTRDSVGIGVFAWFNSS